MLTQDSTVDNLKATSGEQFALGQAQLAAGSMDRSERFAIGNTSINAVRDVMTGGARIESNSGNSFSDGDQVNHNYGLNVKNPVQYAGHETGAFSTTAMGTDDSSILDGASGVAVYGLSATTVAMGADAKFNGGRVTKKVSSTLNDVKHKVKGDVSGVDSEGKKVYFSKETWSDLESNDFAEKSDDGKWKVTQGKEDVKSYLSSTQPSSAGDSKPQSPASTSHKTIPNGIPISASIDSPSNSDAPKIGDMGNYSTETSKPNVNLVKTPLGEVFFSSKLPIR